MTTTHAISSSQRASKFDSIATALTKLQRTYLLLALDRDQALEASKKGFEFGAPPAHVWRWTEYGPIGAKGVLWDGELRRALDRLQLVNSGTGAVWSSLRLEGLLEIELRDTGFVNAYSKKPLSSLFARMTTSGRKGGEDSSRRTADQTKGRTKTFVIVCRTPHRLWAATPG